MKPTSIHIINFFFFKQKTAYEMRISDWSSDVCSSDLRGHRPDRPVGRAPPDHRRRRAGARSRVRRARAGAHGGEQGRAARGRAARHGRQEPRRGSARRVGGGIDEALRHRRRPGAARSEEHTSELQSLMRTSYAVFCLKKKKTHPTQDSNIARTEKTRNVK